MSNEMNFYLKELEKELTISYTLITFLEEIADGNRDNGIEETGSLIPLLCERVHIARENFKYLNFP